MSSRFAVVLLATFVGGCAAAPLPPPVALDRAAPPPQPAASEEAPRPPPVDPFAIRGELREEPANLLAPPSGDLTFIPFPPAPKVVPAAPKSCDAFVRRAAAKPGACATRADLLVALDAAMAEADVGKRDAALTTLEGCAGAPFGLIRALRAELAPVECGDALTEPLVKQPSKTLTSPVYQALLGQALAARQARLGHGMPTMTPPFEKKRVVEHMAGPLRAWLVAQGAAIEETALASVKLASYGRAIVALESGMADMRVVAAARSSPLPPELAGDDELRNIYYGSLDDALEPRKARGRDATLVGLADYGAIGAIHDPRVVTARELLGKLYGGRRIDALDRLLLPPLGAAKTARVEERLAAKLPTFYAGHLLEAKLALDAEVLRALLERGVPAALRSVLKEASVSDEAKTLFARGRLLLGERYWRSFDFDQAAVLTQAPKRTDEATFLLALAIALRGGPASAGQMMLRAPLSALTLGDLAALDAVFASPSPFAGIAGYDAALIFELTTPVDLDGPERVKRVDATIGRYRSALTKLRDPAHVAAATRAIGDLQQIVHQGSVTPPKP